MEILSPLLAILGALTLGVISPGPSFVVVARLAIINSRLDGLYAALGMGFGGMLFSVLALLGLQALLAAVPWLYLLLKIGGGLYLIYLGIGIWRAAKQQLRFNLGDSVKIRGFTKSFYLGMATQLSNPKTAVVYASVFAAFLPQQLPVSVLLVLPLIIFLLEFGWYAIVAYLLSTPSPRSAYLRSKTVIDRLVGAVMGILGARLIATADS